MVKIMPDNKNNIDKELLLKEYELNNNDHDRKENMAWLASTLYYTFCIAVIGFILSNENIKNELNSISCLLKWFIICLLIIIFICVNLFVGYQFDRKYKSCLNIRYLQNILLKNKEIINKLNDRCFDFAKFSIINLIIVFFILKIIIILNIFYPNYFNISFLINFIHNYFFLN